MSLTNASGSSICASTLGYSMNEERCGAKAWAHARPWPNTPRIPSEGAQKASTVIDGGGARKPWKRNEGVTNNSKRPTSMRKQPSAMTHWCPSGDVGASLPELPMDRFRARRAPTNMQPMAYLWVSATPPANAKSNPPWGEGGCKPPELEPCVRAHRHETWDCKMPSAL